MFDQYGKYIFLKNLVDPPYKNIREGKACKFGNGTPRPLFVNAFFDNPHRFVLIKLSYAGDVIWNARVGISPMAAYWANSQAIFALDPSDGSTFVSYILTGTSPGEYDNLAWNIAKILPDGSDI